MYSKAKRVNYTSEIVRLFMHENMVRNKWIQMARSMFKYG